jgi:hypothetical protein
MPRKEAVQVASRALALLMIVWVLVELTQLPQVVLGLAHHLQQNSVLIPQRYWTIYYVAGLSSHAVRMMGLSFAAVWFWKCGPGVEAAFGVRPEAPPAV